MRINYLKEARRADWVVFVSVFILIAFGMAAIYSVALSGGSDVLFLKKQAIAVLIGAVLAAVLTAVNYHALRGFSFVLYAVGVLMLIAVLFFGITVNNTTGWFSFFGFNFQPVEFMKLALIAYFSQYFSERASRCFGMREFATSALIVAVPVVAVMLQPDLGSALLLLSIWCFYIFFAGLPIRYMAALAVSAVAVVVVSWFFFLGQYQHDRILTYLNPSADPLGRGYHVKQAEIAIGSGELFGRGLGFGSQSQLKFLPVSQTDFIFAVIAEELGFVGAAVIFAAFFILLLRLHTHASRAPDAFGAYLLLGIFSLTLVQVAVNLGMNLRLLPVTGIALPYVSYGGSSMLLFAALFGIAQSVIVRISREKMMRGAMGRGFSFLRFVIDKIA
ncbi:MAG: Rod shape-determining protein RodA [uncultured bacterium]|nr:MAG: Rod shape-determining protein RodA [uncultured bacterium]HBD05413.1 rod shape-determining protein RodA [Candidatus Uhrbacteria bacterium]